MTTQVVDKTLMPLRQAKLSEEFAFAERIFLPLFKTEKQCKKRIGRPSFLESIGLSENSRQLSYKVANSASKPNKLSVTLKIGKFKKIIYTVK